MGSGYSKMKKQAKLMEQQLESMRSEMKTKQVIGSSGNGLVTVTFNGEKELQKIEIKRDCVNPDDIEGLQDLIQAACADAYQKIGENSGNGMSLPGGMSLPFGF
jgi:DNA-binding YbaB/EbfC family protein